MFEMSGQEIFGDDAGDQDDYCGGRVIYVAATDEFFDSLNDNIDAGCDNNEGDENGGDAFDFGAVFGQFLVVGEFFAEDDENTGYGIGKAVNGVRDDGYRVRQKPHYDIKNRQQKIDGNKQPARFNNSFAAALVHFFILA